MTPRPSFGAPVVAASAVTLLVCTVAAPRWPDDWDGLGFLASVKRFDLDAFAPHPPGYPVYVALLKLASLVMPSAMGAATLVAALSGALTVLFLGGGLCKAFDAPSSSAALIALAAVATPLGFHCVTAVGSEAPALAFASLALYGLAGEPPWLAVGVGVGLGLGVRISWAPLFLPMLLLVPAGNRARAWYTAAATTLVWSVPFVHEVGPWHLLHLLEVHLMGHATRWGGTALTEPARARYLARDLFVDGLGVDGDLLGVALGVVALATAGLGLRAWRRARWVHGWQVAGMFAPYLVWVLVGQNLREQPRHVLPLVALLAVGLAASGTRAESRRAQSTTPRARWAPRVLFALIVARTGSDAYARHRDPPPGAALASYVASLPDANVVLVFGGASVRFFEGMALAPRARTSESMADVGLALTHADRLPERIFITSEVADAESSHEGRRVATFCRNPRLDRRRPCLDLFEVNPTELRLP